MPVSTLHPEYEGRQDHWRTLRDVMAGDREVKRAGVRYVPRLEGMGESEYRAYVDRGFFYNATARTVSGYLGMIFRREPVMKLPKAGSPLGAALNAFANDADMLGKGVGVYAREVVSEVAVIGRAGTLIDWAGDGEDRAYWSFYRAEDILNWREERINGRMQLTLVVLRESVARDAGDGFATRQSEILRVLRLRPGISGAIGGYSYQVEIWGLENATDSKERELVLLDSKVPVRRGKPLPNIPFIFHGPNLSKPAIEASPIADIVAANLDHYRMNTDFKHGMHYTALPTAWVAGFEKDAVLRIGSSAAWVTETLGATAGYLEFRGEGLKTFERAMDRNERLLSVLGARLLESQKRVSGKCRSRANPSGRG
jgi:hypothetical protein